MLTHEPARHTMLFDWGVAGCLPFRPRMRYRRSILSAARWRLSPRELPGPAASRREWTAALTAARERLHLPATVYVGAADRRLRLDLDDRMDVALLRAHLNRAAQDVTVVEAPTAADHGWFEGRAHEIVIPLATTAPPARAPAVVTSRGPWPLIKHEHSALPGSPVLFAKLYSHPNVVDTILTRHLPVLLAAWDDPPLWWFVRYHTPAPHLRLRLHHLRDYGQAAARVGDLALDTYHPETARYGSGAAMAAAEALFAADSVAVLAQLRALASSPEVHPQALTAASLVDLVCAMTGSQPAGMRWLVEHAHLAGRARVGDRDVLRQALSLAGVGADRSTPPTLSGGSPITSAWHARRVAATRYADLLTAEATSVRPASVAVSLLHLHHVRARDRLRRRSAVAPAGARRRARSMDKAAGNGCMHGLPEPPARISARDLGPGCGSAPPRSPSLSPPARPVSIRGR